MTVLDAHQRPPDDLRVVFKNLCRTPIAELVQDDSIVDFQRGSYETARHGLTVIASQNVSSVRFSSPCAAGNGSDLVIQSTNVHEAPFLPGLHLIPGLLAPEIQLQLLSKLLHRDLTDSRHLTNLHKHYKIPYGSFRSRPSGAEGGSATTDHSEAAGNAEQSFFSFPPSTSTMLEPRDPAIHKPLTINQFLTKKLRWVTLGGQYDWTTKQYPKERPPRFPKDVGDLVGAAFPDMQPEAAIVNVYSPGDTLSLHRDVSEASSKGLVSISLGCEAIFLAGLENEDGSKSKHIAVRLRSGDAVYMSGVGRYAWHGVPRIVPNSCPLWMRAWPAETISLLATDRQGTSAERMGNFEDWRDWMASKRINLNVRQMFDEEQQQDDPA